MADDPQSWNQVENESKHYSILCLYRDNIGIFMVLSSSSNNHELQGKSSCVLGQDSSSFGTVDTFEMLRICHWHSKWLQSLYYCPFFFFLAGDISPYKGPYLLTPLWGSDSGMSTFGGKY